MNYTNTHDLPSSIVDAVTKNTYDIDRTDPSIISITTLIGPPRIRQLTIRHWDEIEEDVSENIWRLLGDCGHVVLSRVKDADRFIEERLREKVNGVIVTGRTDLYEAKKKLIQDYKVTSAWSIVYNPEGKPEWIQQGQGYAWLWRKAGFDVKGIRIIAILRDWQKSKALADKKYPQIPIAVVNVPLWTPERQEEYIKQRVTLHCEATGLSDENLPLCSPEERWQSKNVYALMKPGRKRAIKLFNTAKEADNAQALSSKADKTYIEERPGEDKRCNGYCSLTRWCNHCTSGGG